jgi:hypothetical protein
MPAKKSETIPRKKKSSPGEKVSKKNKVKSKRISKPTIKKNKSLGGMYGDVSYENDSTTINYEDLLNTLHKSTDKTKLIYKEYEFLVSYNNSSHPVFQLNNIKNKNIKSETLNKITINQNELLKRESKSIYHPGQWQEPGYNQVYEDRLIKGFTEIDLLTGKTSIALQEGCVNGICKLLGIKRE